MSVARWYVYWFVAAVVIGGAIGLLIFEPGGTSANRSEEFGREVVAPILAGAGVAVLIAAPLATIGAVVRDLISRHR